MPAMSSKNPALRMSVARIRPIPNTIVFGGVATGSINPSEAASVAGTISINGAMPVTF